jgi:hypothetical protein
LDRQKQTNPGIDTQGSYRAQLRCRLAIQRAELLWQLVGLDEGTLTRWPVCDGRTAKDVLAHVAGQDGLYARCIERVLDGQEGIGRVDGTDSTAGVDADRREQPLEDTLEVCLAARARFLSALARVEDEQLHRTLPSVNGGQSIDGWARRRYEEDSSLARQLGQWRKDQSLKRSSGPRSLLLATLKAGRKELLLSTTLVPTEHRETRPVGGGWTLKDVLGHVTEWELVCLDGLRQIAGGRLPEGGYDGELEGWNCMYAEARRELPWETVWHELHATRQGLLKVVQQLRDDQLTRVFVGPLTAQDTAYAWLRVCLAHDREHAREVRAAIGFD